uniref:Uncharacterized protein n=1 Tax=Noctiluca scintillans TaxID=2966 RepID=A0A7S1EZA8_NOCSC|mmetsp:Transcript_20508/g.54972  ORF Transcript_20508/g.54972 Transcript_20508/m.54972 type:complete len:116 (+) Transcript_20508:87-434(+)
MLVRDTPHEVTQREEATRATQALERHGSQLHWAYACHVKSSIVQAMARSSRALNVTYQRITRQVGHSFHLSQLSLGPKRPALSPSPTDNAHCNMHGFEVEVLYYSLQKRTQNNSG